jgi:hypothetical protein
MAIETQGEQSRKQMEQKEERWERKEAGEEINVRQSLTSDAQVPLQARSQQVAGLAPPSS